MKHLIRLNKVSYFLAVISCLFGASSSSFAYTRAGKPIDRNLIESRFAPEGTFRQLPDSVLTDISDYAAEEQASTQEAKIVALFDEMLEEATDFLKGVKNKARAAEDLLASLEAMKVLKPQFRFASSDSRNITNSRSITAWVNPGLFVININTDGSLLHAFAEDKKEWKKTLLHEAIHLAGFPHGSHQHEYAYPVSALVYAADKIRGPSMLAQIMLQSNVDTKNYVNAFVRYFKDLNVDLDCMEPTEAPRVGDSRVRTLEKQSQDNFAAISKHLNAIYASTGFQYAKDQIDSFRVKTDGNIRRLGVGATSSGSRDVGRLSGFSNGKVHGFVH